MTNRVQLKFKLANTDSFERTWSCGAGATCNIHALCVSTLSKSTCNGCRYPGKACSDRQSWQQQQESRVRWLKIIQFVCQWFPATARARARHPSQPGDTGCGGSLKVYSEKVAQQETLYFSAGLVQIVPNISVILMPNSSAYWGVLC